jgi:threonylcarbamoyladenosine tRNA methylthiotransferase MtaB
LRGTNQITVALETLGCKLNQAESEKLARDLAKTGCRIVQAGEKADIYILNSCTVTRIADRKSRHLLRMAHRKNPDAVIIATGCYAERDPSALAQIEGVALVASNEEKASLSDLLVKHGYLIPASAGLGTGLHYRTRSFIKVQDGCNQSCAYCVVPFVRGREKSLPPDQVIDEVRRRVEDGYREVVLTGTEIGRYHRSGLGLKGLLERILAETETCRLRLSSLQPQEIAPGLIDLWRNPRLCRHFHLSLQSGSDSVLHRMGRRYTTLDYSAKVDFIRSKLPEAAITTDIIVGFPGETGEEFQESYDFCRRMRFARVHVFSYSAREGTRAALMPDQIAATLKKERSEKMIFLAGELRQSFHQRFPGAIETVLFEQCENGLWSGLTDSYIKVYVESADDLANRLLCVKLVELRGDGMGGEIVGQGTAHS